MNDRTIPALVRAELEQENTSEAVLVFLKIQQSQLNDTIRVVSDPEDFWLNNDSGIPELYKGFEFEIKLLTDTDGPPSANLAVQNVDRQIGDNILQATDPVRLEIRVISLSEFDETKFPRVALNNPVNHIYRAKHLRLIDVEGNIFTVSGTIRSWDYTQENWPGLRVTEERFPGIYW